MKGLALSLLILFACEGDYNEQEENQTDSSVTEAPSEIRKKTPLAGINQTGGNDNEGGQSGKGGQTNQGGETVSLDGGNAGSSMGGRGGMDAMAGVCFISGCRYPETGCCYNKNGGCLTNGSCLDPQWERIGCVCK
jgi:hypothetical protein